MLARVLTICAVCLAAGPAAAGGSDADQIEEAYRTVYQIDIEDAKGRHRSIDKVVVLLEDRAFTAKVRYGFSRTNQNRVDYSGVPIVGRLSQHRFDKEDVTPANRVGEARIDGSVLALVVDEGAAVVEADVEGVAVLNKAFAYETRLPLKPGEWAASVARPNWTGAGRLVGDVYWTGGGPLIALVRPFVVTDGGLW